jgi:hypothetical protein
MADLYEAFMSQASHEHIKPYHDRSRIKMFQFCILNIFEKNQKGCAAFCIPSFKAMHIALSRSCGARWTPVERPVLHSMLFAVETGRIDKLFSARQQVASKVLSGIANWSLIAVESIC